MFSVQECPFIPRLAAKDICITVGISFQSLQHTQSSLPWSASTTGTSTDHGVPNSGVVGHLPMQRPKQSQRILPFGLPSQAADDLHSFPRWHVAPHLYLGSLDPLRASAAAWGSIVFEMGSHQTREATWRRWRTYSITHQHQALEKHSIPGRPDIPPFIWKSLGDLGSSEKWWSNTATIMLPDLSLLPNFINKSLISLSKMSAYYDPSALRRVSVSWKLLASCRVSDGQPIAWGVVRLWRLFFAQWWISCYAFRLLWTFSYFRACLEAKVLKLVTWHRRRGCWKNIVLSPLKTERIDQWHPARLTGRSQRASELRQLRLQRHVDLKAPNFKADQGVGICPGPLQYQLSCGAVMLQPDLGVSSASTFVNYEVALAHVQSARAQFLLDLWSLLDAVSSASNSRKMAAK